MPAKMCSISLLLSSLFILQSPTLLNAQTIYWKKDYIRDASGSTIAVATPQPTDTTAPLAPGTPSSTTTTATSVALSWTAPSGGADGYVIYRGPIPVGAVSGSTFAFTDVGLLPYTPYSYRIVAFDASHNYSSYSSTLNVTTSAASGAPLSLTATASSTSQVNLAWSAPGSGAPHHYGVWRRSSGSWTKIDTSSSASYADTTVSASTAYLYKVSAENSSNVVQGYTNIDLATTVMFTDDTITIGSTLIKAVHITELRTAINAVRTAAGLDSATWTNSSLSGAWIKAVDISELRLALGDAVNLLGLTAPNYTDTTLVGTTVKKAHIDELRQRVK